MSEHTKTKRVLDLLTVYLRSALELVHEQSEKNAARMSPRWRPLVGVVSFFILIPYFLLLNLFFLALLAPIMMVVRILDRKTKDPYFLLETELRTEWTSDGRDRAVSKLTRVWRELKDKNGRLFVLGVAVKPFGRFRYKHYAKLSWLLFHWAFAIDDFNLAREVAEEMLSLTNFDKKPLSDYDANWAINKARAMRSLDGDAAALEFLFQLADPTNENCLISKYIRETRAS